MRQAFCGPVCSLTLSLSAFHVGRTSFLHSFIFVFIGNACWRNRHSLTDKANEKASQFVGTVAARSKFKWITIFRKKNAAVRLLFYWVIFVLTIIVAVFCVGVPGMQTGEKELLFFLKATKGTIQHVALWCISVVRKTTGAKIYCFSKWKAESRGRGECGKPFFVEFHLGAWYMYSNPQCYAIFTAKLVSVDDFVANEIIRIGKR